MNGQSVDLRCDVEEWRACGEEENESGNGSRRKRDGRVELHICRADAKTRSRFRFTTLQPSSNCCLHRSRRAYIHRLHNEELMIAALWVRR